MMESVNYTDISRQRYSSDSLPKHNAAVELMKACWEYENGRLSIQVLQEFFVTVTRKIASPLDLLTA
jgi:hypothetical protein